jgi:hypothetical protein
MRPLDPTPWNLVAASGLALAACQAPKDTGDDEEIVLDDDGLYYECSYWNECGPGDVCLYGYCETAHGAMLCEHAELVEIPLPQLEPSLAITFADLDGDGDDELVSIDANGVSVVLADGSVVLTPWPETHDFAWVTALELQGDGSLDLAVGFRDGMLLLAGMGDGSFTHLTTHESLPAIEEAEPIDPDGDGVDQLVARTDSLLWFPDVGAGGFEAVAEPATSLTIANVWGTNDSPPEILADQLCQLSIIDANDFDLEEEVGAVKVGMRCKWQVAPLAGLAPAMLAVGSASASDLTQLTLIDSDGWARSAAKLSGFVAQSSTFVDLENAEDPVLALVDESSLALVWDWDRFPDPCVEFLDGAADGLAAGDRDGDGRQELAVSHDGAIRLLHVP